MDTRSVYKQLKTKQLANISMVRSETTGSYSYVNTTVAEMTFLPGFSGLAYHLRGTENL